MKSAEVIRLECLELELRTKLCLEWLYESEMVKLVARILLIQSELKELREQTNG